MTASIRVALVGDFDPKVLAHQAIPRALALAAESTGIDVIPEWVSTRDIATEATMAPFDAVWCVPASPYRSTRGALRAIQFARTNDRPFLGTCGGFQHAVLEYARAVLGWSDAAHAEMEPDATTLVVTPLDCALVETSDVVHLWPGSLLRAAYGVSEITETYRCRYGLNPAFRTVITAGPLRVAAEDRDGAVRALELDGHPFFVATLFQPERAALEGNVPPIVAAFVRAAAHVDAESRRAASAFTSRDTLDTPQARGSAGPRR